MNIFSIDVFIFNATLSAVYIVVIVAADAAVAAAATAASAIALTITTITVYFLTMYSLNAHTMGGALLLYNSLALSPFSLFHSEYIKYVYETSNTKHSRTQSLLNSERVVKQTAHGTISHLYWSECNCVKMG